MDNGYRQVHEYAFPDDFSRIQGLHYDGTYHGEALTLGPDGHLYALFYINIGSGYQNYYESVVVQFEIDESSGELDFKKYVTVGKNSFTLDLYDNKLWTQRILSKKMLLLYKLQIQQKMEIFVIFLL